ncbi:MAG TPA: class I SAM-dependent methyltransferase [Anaeromyxobacter sp.]|nr:class I SAM-dependent methyltransferase [Anaeromyxobacter sp.]
MDASALAAVRAAYDAVATAYAGQFLHELDAKPFDRALLVGFAELARGQGRVADLGTGCGHVARLLKEHGVDVFGVDFSPATIALARDLHRDVGLELVEDDYFALHLADGALAGVTAFYAYVHLEPADLPAAFREVARVLRPGAPFLVGFHVGDDALHVEEWLGHRVGLDWRFFPMAAVTGALEAAGLAVEARVERAAYASEYPTPRGYVLARKRG